MKNVFLTDVLDQPAAMRKALAHYKSYGEIFEKLAVLKPKQVLFTGMGSSHYCSIPAVIRLIAGGISARVESAGEILYYEPNAIGSDTLLVLTSQSGESGEIVTLIDKLPKEQTVIGITNDPDSTLGRRADVCFLMQVAPELAVSTRTYLASLILSDLLAAALLGEDLAESLHQNEMAVDALESFLGNHGEMQKQIADFFGHPGTVSYIGRGPALSTAECGGLFTRETAKYPALAFDSGEFRHGPYEMVDDSFCAMLFAPGGKTIELQRHLTDAISNHGGKAIFVTDKDAEFQSENILVLRHPAIPEQYAPLVQIVAPQLFANDMALYRGFEPGMFRQSSKVTTEQ